MPSKRTLPSIERLRQARIEAGLTQETVGERAGLTRTSVSRYESGIAPPSELALNMLATIYDKPYEWFFRQAEPAAPPVQPPQPPDPIQELLDLVREMHRMLAERLPPP